MDRRVFLTALGAAAVLPSLPKAAPIAKEAGTVWQFYPSALRNLENGDTFTLSGTFETLDLKSYKFTHMFLEDGRHFEWSDGQGWIELHR